ncbi:MAG: 3'-5' exonuclease [Coprococcus sp.]
MRPAVTAVCLTFMRYIEQLKKNQIDFGEAVMPENDKGRVRIMSIHKSKGLEYPIVILAGLGKNLIFRTASASWLCMQRAASGWMRSIFRPAKR